MIEIIIIEIIIIIFEFFLKNKILNKSNQIVDYIYKFNSYNI